MAAENRSVNEYPDLPSLGKGVRGMCRGIVSFSFVSQTQHSCLDSTAGEVEVDFETLMGHLRIASQV